MTMSVSSRVNSAPPDILPASSALASRPWTVVPRGATTVSSTCKFVSRLAVKRYPACCLLESRESTMRTKMRVPTGTAIFVRVVCPGASPEVITSVANKTGPSILFRIMFISRGKSSRCFLHDRQCRLNLEINKREQLVFDLKETCGLNCPKRLLHAFIVGHQEISTLPAIVAGFLNQLISFDIRHLVVVAGVVLNVCQSEVVQFSELGIILVVDRPKFCRFICVQSHHGAHDLRFLLPNVRAQQFDVCLNIFLFCIRGGGCRILFLRDL